MNNLESLSDKDLIEYYTLYSKIRGTRLENVKIQGQDSKFLYHLVRLLNEVEQIMMEGTLDLERNREQLKSIRRGEWTLEQIEQYFSDKEKALEDLYVKSDLPHSPDEEEIKSLLLTALEMHFGKLDSNTIVRVDEASQKLKRIREILES